VGAPIRCRMDLEGAAGDENQPGRRAAPQGLEFSVRFRHGPVRRSGQFRSIRCDS
jgi:hypothetical protein